MKKVLFLQAVQLLVLGTLVTTTFAQDDLPPEIQEVKIRQRLGNQVPLNLQFQDSTGKTITLGDYVTDQPVILVLAYYRCPRLCSRVLNELVKTLRQIPLDLGNDYVVLTVSFDPRETAELAAANKQAYLEAYGKPSECWYFLTGKEPNIKRLADAVGFRYVWDEKRNQYQHSTAVMVLTPKGKVSRYYFGIDYSPRDIQTGLEKAGGNEIGPPVSQVLLLTCMSYNPSTGKYTVTAFKLMRTAAIVTVLGVGCFLGWNWWKEHRKKAIA